MISPYTPGSPGGEMQCAACGQHTPDNWRKLISRVSAYEPHVPHATTLESPGPYDSNLPRDQQVPDAVVEFDWMVCANPKCHELTVRMHETRAETREEVLSMPSGERLKVVGPTGDQETKTVTVRPRFSERPIPSEVRDPYRKDYREATAILSFSPRMSAVLSRRILGDLLEEYARLTQFRLEDRIDAFVADLSRPRELRENMHYFREIANFGAHTQKDNQQEIIDVSEEEAAWTLDVLDSLFDHFIVSPARDRTIRDSIAQKIEQAGRKPIEPLPPDPEVPSE